MSRSEGGERSVWFWGLKVDTGARRVLLEVGLRRVLAEVGVRIAE